MIDMDDSGKITAMEIREVVTMDWPFFEPINDLTEKEV